MRSKIDFRSENGAAYVMEAVIVYPIVMIAVVFLIMVGMTFAQKSMLQHHANELSTYIAKVIRYPGYQYIEKPFYEGDSDGEVTREMVDNAMKQIDPYRYLFNIIGNQYRAPTDSNGDQVVSECEVQIVKYLDGHGFLKPAAGAAPKPSSSTYSGVKYAAEQNGRSCYISATTSRVSVYLGQYYVFADFFRMIGVGGKRMTITGECTTYVCDTVELVRITDMAFDVVNFVAGKLGLDLDKITDAIQKVTGNSGK